MMDQFTAMNQVYVGSGIVLTPPPPPPPKKKGIKQQTAPVCPDVHVPSIDFCGQIMSTPADVYLWQPTQASHVSKAHLHIC